MLIALCKLIVMLRDFRRAFDPNPRMEFKIIIIKKTLKLQKKTHFNRVQFQFCSKFIIMRDFNINNKNNCVTPSLPIIFSSSAIHWIRLILLLQIYAVAIEMIVHY